MKTFRIQNYLIKAVFAFIAGSTIIGCSSSDDSDNLIAPPESKEYSKYVTKVIEFMPAPGQFVNTLPQYTAGDNAAAMVRKAEAEVVGQTNGVISLGGYGGYIVVGFDHTIQNIAGEKDFKVYGNAFPNNSEPGIVMVAYDKNKNGKPDADEWYELAGSEYSKSVKKYTITYTRPNPLSGDCIWKDNQGNSGAVYRNEFHDQESYFPLWYTGDEITFTGTLLSNNAIDKSTIEGEYWSLPAYDWGYADNQENSSVLSDFDIDWAVDSTGQKITLPGVDFIKIYTGVNQNAGWLGETSTEFSGIEDLHIVK